MNAVDPIPGEDWHETWPASDDAPGGVRFLAFNTVAEIAAYGPGDAVAAALDEAVALCRVYERLLSRTLPHSDVARLNDAGGVAVEVDARTFALMEAALGYCAASEGAFDVTVGPAVRLWDFHAGVEPEPAALAEAVRHVDWRALELWHAEAAETRRASGRGRGAAEADAAGKTGARARGADAGATPACDADARDGGAGTEADAAACAPTHAESPCAQPGAGRFFARLADPRAAVDVGGIAKGWIADELTALLAARGLAGFVVNLGGNVAVGGAKPDGAPWRVGIRDPRDPHDPAALLGAVPLASGSAVTSGVYERSFTTADGRFCHHILDPRTGRPAATDVAGVTVVTDRSLDAEGFSTTLLALGLERGLTLARRHAEIRQAFFVDFDGQVTPAR